jgi:hypothetical protein
MLVEVHAGENISGCGGQTLSQTARDVSFFWAEKGEQQSNKGEKWKAEM